ncbi:MAG: hypothetical protein HY877_03865 [Deltaproteobacteria bacterium]|nr:hypothetical protein [Deltaproteobacteria bacterium]
MAVSKDLGRTHSQMARLLLEGINGLDDEIQKVAILRLVDFHFTGVKRYYDLLADALINHEGDRMEQAAPEERSAWLENVATILLARHRADLSGMGINNVLNGRLTFEGFADEINATYEDGGESVNLAATAHYLLFRRLTELGFVKMAGEEREKVRTMARPGSVLLIKIGAN